ncbi:MAG: thiamine-phosphate pyrophosphorylase, partial [Vampirovibrionia bacterium]
MNDNYRIIDVNLNRASEALRILEEVARFKLNDKSFTENFKNIRHNINNAYSEEYAILLGERDSVNDVGPKINNDSQRTTIVDIIKANFK